MSRHPGDSESPERGASDAARRQQIRATSQPLLPARRPADPERYRLYPSTPMVEGRIDLGWDAIAERFAPVLHEGGVVGIDGVSGVLWDRLREDLHEALERLGVQGDWHDVRNALLAPEELERALAPYLTDDPLFGERHPGTLADVFDADRLDELGRTLATGGGRIVLGPGAALALENVEGRPPLLAWVDVPKNEVQYRARAGSIANLGAAGAEDPKAMYKRFYFVDWVLCGRHLARHLPSIDVMIDAQRPHEPASTSGADLRAGLRTLAEVPFRPRPWFEPGVWGGRWIAERIPELPQDVPNYAWSFELIAPENGILLEADGILLEVPFEMLMYQENERVLGVHAARFGTEFPIRFDFLDTMDGENLSLQCHPSPEYIRRYGERLAQDETYYILDAAPCAEVLLGFRDGVDPASFREEVERSARTGEEVDVRRWVQTHPANAHDLFLIPHGTIHCSGAGNMVLEISATPYIFTFKIYDWLRLDLDGRPRPLNIERAFENLDFSRQGPAVPRTLISRPARIASGDGYVVEHLATHPEHFYDVHRIHLTGEVDVATDGSCHLLSLVDGESFTIETEGGRRSFYYAETVLVPAAVQSYRLASDTGAPLAIVKAFLEQNP